MIYKALDVIQIFGAGERTDERTNEGVPRGPRGPKNVMPDWFCFLNFFSFITVLGKKCGGNTFLEG